MWVIAPAFWYFLKSKFKENWMNGLGLFSTDSIYSRRSGQGPQWLIFDFRLKVISSSIILFTIVALLTGLVFNYSVVIWLIAPIFWYVLKSKFKENLKTRLGLFSTDAIYSRRSRQELHLLWRRRRSLSYI